VFSNFVEGTILISGPAAVDELPPDREAAEVVDVEVWSWLPHAASAPR